jgi:hydrogenase-4 component B
MILLFKIALLLSFLIFFLPKNLKYYFGLALHILLVITSSAWAWKAMYENAYSFSLGVETWSGPIQLVIDPLSGYFMLLINLICFCGILYGGGYLKPYLPKKSAVFISLHLFSFLWLHGAMLLVVSIQDGIAFLLAWELMSLFSFILVIFEAQKEATLKTGINYLLQMHLGFALIMLGFLIAANQTGDLSFNGVNKFFATKNNIPLFLIFFSGFGIKAGFIPFHSWLPRAHPAAPSHVSGVMSGIMIKMGIYGIFRVITLLQADLQTIGILVLVAGIVAGLLGVIMAIMQHDLKKLLAYHSIENIGIIGIGMGVGLVGKASGEDYLMVLGFAGALLHTLNHALFKSLLFFTAGNVLYITHKINMDHLGGLAKNMRWTTAAFLIGALAISGLPPFNGFISEFLIYNALINQMSHSAFGMSLLSVASILSLVLIGGLCIYCFTKAFGLSFLGTRREIHPKEATEVPFRMLVPSFLLILVMLSIGLMPGIYVKQVIGVVYSFTGVALDMPPIFAYLQSVSDVNIILIVVVVAIAGIRYYQHSRVKISSGPTWGCGYTAGDFRHQYTPTSYAESLRELADPVIQYRKAYKPFEETEVFPPPKSFHTESKDLIEEKTILSWVHLIVNYLPKAGITQSGVINHYLIYPMLFLLFIGFLIIINVL